jgi:hypothetical protein
MADVNAPTAAICKEDVAEDDLGNERAGCALKRDSTKGSTSAPSSVTIKGTRCSPRPTEEISALACRAFEDLPYLNVRPSAPARRGYFASVKLPSNRIMALVPECPNTPH